MTVSHHWLKKSRIGYVFNWLSNHALAVGPCKILKRLNENRRRRNLNLLYIIQTFQHFQKQMPNILTLLDRQTKHKPYCFYPIEEPCMIRSSKKKKRKKKKNEQSCPYPIEEPCIISKRIWIWIKIVGTNTFYNHIIPFI